MVNDQMKETGTNMQPNLLQPSTISPFYYILVLNIKDRLFFRFP